MQVASLQQVTAHYGGQDVLKGVSFTVNTGEKLGLIGANGSGKTTILRILLGRDEPAGGTVTLASGTRVGYVPQYIDAEDDELVMDWLLAGHVAPAKRLRPKRKRSALSGDVVDDVALDYPDSPNSYDRLAPRSLVGAGAESP
ncbi:MAG: ATP-binding cassette domain-containing protein [Chloroflexi bacterium]|nr:ATP-binding cassette domain-containing protein [Chloroflexota bacterium]